jgi:hypothetical protein
MSRAANHARKAWSSNTTGAPKTAMMPSPVNLSADLQRIGDVGQPVRDVFRPVRPPQIVWST